MKSHIKVLAIFSLFLIISASNTSQDIISPDEFNARVGKDQHANISINATIEDRFLLNVPCKEDHILIRGVCTKIRIY
ncbi:hypothetical protein NQ315_007573 [Exocentrus adspersus]|uniref:Uncharacterized protein n=1 Tax=Exocentrus adspersus TaxID=1586481 RepID=A0AAV8W7Y7_9CUCU|nr:hypothetical protein NQ315_007573 [Exocentrus adspersus]